jgi:hypothetical protein
LGALLLYIALLFNPTTSAMNSQFVLPRYCHDMTN